MKNHIAASLCINAAISSRRVRSTSIPLFHLGAVSNDSLRLQFLSPNHESVGPFFYTLATLWALFWSSSRLCQSITFARRGDSCLVRLGDGLQIRVVRVHAIHLHTARTANAVSLCQKLIYAPSFSSAIRVIKPPGLR